MSSVAQGGWVGSAVTGGGVQQWMQGEYVRLLGKFYGKCVEGSGQAALLSHAADRFLNYEAKEEEKAHRAREKEGSLRSASSGSSLSHFEKVKRLFYSSSLQAALLFHYCLARLKARQAAPLVRLFTHAADRLKTMRNAPPPEEKRKFALRLGKFTEALLYLEARASEGCAVEWLYLEAFKDFEAECALAVQVLGSVGDTLETRETLRAAQYADALRAMRTECRVFDYTSREAQQLGGPGEGEPLFIGRRADTFFILTEKEYDRAVTSSLTASRKQLDPVRSPAPTAPSAKFKEEFLAEMAKLRQGYEANTATIASLFHFKDAGEARTLDEIYQA